MQLPHLDANQLKLFQQLTQTVNSEAKPFPIQTHAPPPLAPTTVSSEVVAGPSNPPAYWNNPRNTSDKPWDAGNNYQASPVEENNYHGHRGRFRGGYRSRGRGRFGDRDREGYRERFYDTTRSPPSGHGRTSRSRSPPRSRYGGGAGRRDIKPYSPPHRPSIVDQPDLDATQDSSSQQQHPGVDEFGREIRPSSDDDGRRSETPDDPKSRPSLPPPTAHTHTHLSPTSNSAVVEGALPVSDEQESSATPQMTSANAAGGSEALHQDTAGGVSLATFDYSTFDPTSPSSWEALGKAWAATNGRQPLQEELMMFVMEFTVSSMASQALPGGPAAQVNNQWTTGQGQIWMGDPPPSRGGPPRGGRGRGGAFGGRGGRRGFHSGGNSRVGWEYGGDGYAGYGDVNGTDAIVLGEHTNDTQSSEAHDAPVHEQVGQAGSGQGEEGEDGQMGNQGATGTGGRMQKVGDNWVFVRNDGSS